MIFTPKAIFFDWDHTLWDHDTNAKEALHELFVSYKLNQKSSHHFEAFFAHYSSINHQLWEDYQYGRISQEELRATRFKRVFEQIAVDADHQAFGDDFLYTTPRKTKLLPGAKEIIEELSQKYPLYILTNGFSDVQDIKISGSGLKSCFQAIITSEEAKAKKPDSAFFQFALRQANCAPNEALMIGDHETIDVWGAVQVGIPGIHLCESPAKSKAERKITQLVELKNWIAL
jgi:putative hydrolase of the HAD superfamily